MAKADAPGRIEITAKRDGFYRGGMRHPSAPTVHPADAFSAEQLAAIRAEPMLMVRDLSPDQNEHGDGK